MNRSQRFILSMAAILVACSATFAVNATQSTGKQLPDTPAGHLVSDYIKAFNSGEEKLMREFIAGNVAKSALERRSADERINVYQQMYHNTGGLELKVVLEVKEDAITVLFHTKKGEWRRITFELDPEPPHKLLGLRVEDADPPAGAQSESHQPTDHPNALNSQAGQPRMTEAEVLAATKKYLDDLANADRFSGVVLMARRGQLILEKACGLASKEYNVPNRIDTKFNLGSINKIFTHIAIGQLIQQGKLSFDGTIGQYLPDYRNRDAATKVTVRQLLNMTSGIGDFFNRKFEATPKDQIRTIQDFLALFVNEPLEFEPGTREKYSNGGYIVLGAIIEKISGHSYYDYVRDHIFKLAGMADTDSFEAGVPVSNRATGYTVDGGSKDVPRRNNIYGQPARGSSAGGGYSTAPDLLRFALTVQANKLLSPAYTTWFMTGAEPSDAGKGGPTGGGGRTRPPGIGFAGGSPGVNAVLASNPTTGYTVIVLSNYDPPIATEVHQQIRGWLQRIKE